VGKEDPVAASETTFVVVQEDGKYYFVPNVDRVVIARHLRELVRIKGELSPKYNEIRAETIEVKKNDKWRVVWDVYSPFNP
jgi:hypothetical protein